MLGQPAGSALRLVVAYTLLAERACDGHAPQRTRLRTSHVRTDSRRRSSSARRQYHQKSAAALCCRPRPRRTRLGSCDGQRPSASLCAGCGAASRWLCAHLPHWSCTRMNGGAPRCKAQTLHTGSTASVRATHQSAVQGGGTEVRGSEATPINFGSEMMFCVACDQAGSAGTLVYVPSDAARAPRRPP